MNTDVSKAIQPKSDQINADDLMAEAITGTVQQVEVKDTPEQPISIWFTGRDRPYKPCKSMGRVLAKAWGTDSANWQGKSMTLYRDDYVKWAGVAVGGIRISHLTDIQQPINISLTASRGKRAPFKVLPLVIQVQYYDDSQFNEQLPRMLEAISSGSQTVEQIVQYLEKTAKLTDNQKQQITNSGEF